MTSSSESKGNSESVQITGSVENVVFHNNENGYTVCSVKLDSRNAHAGRSTVTVVGKCAVIWEGEELRACGQWIRHPQHGLQFCATSITCITPTSAEGIRRYLASGLIKGIGPKFANRIVDKFGEETVSIIDSQSQRLCEVEGIGESRRKAIKASWTEQKNVRDIMIFLQSLHIGTAKAARIYRCYGEDAIAIIKRNPYRLCSDVWGIGFKSADAIAANMGIERNSLIRARAGLAHVVRSEAEDNGHCYVADAELLLTAQDILGIPAEILDEALALEFQDGQLVLDEGKVYLKELYGAEIRVASKLRTLLKGKLNYPPIPAAKAIEWVEKKIGIVLAASQIQALSNALESKVSIITGGPGVGKTTIIRALVEIFSARRLVSVLAAPTGRAAKRMSESTGRPAQTIHRLLKYNPQTNQFTYNSDNPMEGDCFILDETSMLDIRLADRFLQALPNTATLIVVGDTDQLPSVGPGNVLWDMINSGVIPCCKLDTIFRQDNTGLIVKNAHRVNRGEMFVSGVSGGDFYFIDTEEPEKIISRVVSLMTERIPKSFSMDAMNDVQVLTPMRKNSLGLENMNAVLQRHLNPEGPALLRGTVQFRERDRVMQLRNNYDKEVFNGDIGFIKKVDVAENELVVIFDGRPVKYTQSELDELVHAYACSVHKSQGSEYPAVIVMIHTQHFVLLKRNLLYTAITRGKKLCVVVGSSRAVHIAIDSNQIRERRTALAKRIGEKLNG